MRRRRRVEIQIERREIALYSGGGPLPAQVTNLSRPDGPGSPPVAHTSCPACGSPDLLPLADAVSYARLDLSLLNQGMESGSVHFHSSPSGEWWLCIRSLTQS